MHVSTKKGTGGRTARFSFFLGTPKSWPGRKGRGFPFHPCVCALLWQQPRYLFPWRPPGRAAWTGPRSSTCIIASDKVNFQNKRFLNPTSTKIHNIFPCNFGWFSNNALYWVSGYSGVFVVCEIPSVFGERKSRFATLSHFLLLSPKRQKLSQQLISGWVLLVKTDSMEGRKPAWNIWKVLGWKMDRSQSKIDFWSNSEKLRPTEQIYHLEHKKTFQNQNVVYVLCQKQWRKLG